MYDISQQSNKQVDNDRKQRWANFVIVRTLESIAGNCISSILSYISTTEYPTDYQSNSLHDKEKVHQGQVICKLKVWNKFFIFY